MLRSSVRGVCWRAITAIYVGDDETDEDAFRAGRPGSLLGIRIGLPRGLVSPVRAANAGRNGRLPADAARPPAVASHERLGVYGAQPSLRIA